MPFLKSSLPENQPVIVRITERFAPQDGQYGPKFPYTIVMNGTAYSHDATMTEEKGLQKFQVGQEAQVTKKLNSYGKHSLFWNAVPSGLPPMNQDTYTTQNPPPKPIPVKPEVDWDAIADSKILFGFMVAFIEQGKDENQAYAKGMAAFRLHKKGEIEMRTGIPSASIAHSPAQVQVVNEIFGADQSAPLPDSPEDYRE